MQRTPHIRRSPTACYVGIALVVVGFALIAIAWNGASELELVQGQFPFFISGGLTGIGLIIVGVTVVVIDTLRRDAELRSIEIGRLSASLSALIGELARMDAHPTSAGGDDNPQPRVSAAADGQESADQTIELATVRDRPWEAAR